MHPLNDEFVRLYRIAESKGMDQRAVADMLHITQASVSRCLSGKQIPRMITIESFRLRINDPGQALTYAERLAALEMRDPRSAKVVKDLILSLEAQSLAAPVATSIQPRKIKDVPPAVEEAALKSHAVALRHLAEASQSLPSPSADATTAHKAPTKPNTPEEEGRRQLPQAQVPKRRAA